MMNPISLIKMMNGKMNPQQIAMNLLGQNNNPMINNLIKMANDGNQKGVEDFARNLFKGQGRDFDKEMSSFMSNFKN